MQKLTFPTIYSTVISIKQLTFSNSSTNSLNYLSKLAYITVYVQSDLSLPELQQHFVQRCSAKRGLATHTLYMREKNKTIVKSRYCPTLYSCCKLCIIDVARHTKKLIKFNIDEPKINLKAVAWRALAIVVLSQTQPIGCGEHIKPRPTTCLAAPPSESPRITLDDRRYGAGTSPGRVRRLSPRDLILSTPRNV